MKVTIYSKSDCIFCERAIALANQKGHDLTVLKLDEDFTREQLFEQFPTARSFPQIIVDGETIGGFKEFNDLLKS